MTGVMAVTGVLAGSVRHGTPGSRPPPFGRCLGGGICCKLPGMRGTCRRALQDARVGMQGWHGGLACDNFSRFSCQSVASSPPPAFRFTFTLSTDGRLA